MSLVDQIADGIKGQDGIFLGHVIRLEDRVRKPLDGSPLATILKQVTNKVDEKWQVPVIAMIKMHLATTDDEKFVFALQMSKSIVSIAKSVPGVWIVPVVYSACSQLKILATACGLIKELENCSYVLNSALKALMHNPTSSDTNPKAVGYYVIANMLLSIYFRVRAFSLAGGVVRSTSSLQRLLVPVDELGAKMRVPWLYYSGVLAMIDQDYSKAANLLHQAFSACSDEKVAHLNQEVILFYLIPSQIIAQRRFPGPKFPWSKYRALKLVYKDMIIGIKSGNCTLYRSRVQANRHFLVSKHLYLAILHLEPICRLHLAQKVWCLRDRFDKLDIQDFVTAFKLAGVFDEQLEADPEMQSDSVQLYLATMIRDGDMLGVIYSGLQKLVLRKSNPFPTIKAR